MPNRPSRGTRCALVPLLFLGAVEGAFPEVVTLGAVADTCLWELDPDYNFGRQRTLPAGSIGVMTPASMDRARALFRFDLAGALPAGAVIEAARLTLTVSTQIPTGARVSDFALNRVLVDWSEGAGFGENPGGRVAVAGESTWNNRLHPGTPWSVPGGGFGTDFAADSCALVMGVNGSDRTPTKYIFEFNPPGLEDLGRMRSGEIPNHGWVLHSLGEGTRRTARRWVSRETINEGPAPELQITYTLAPAVPPVVITVELDPEAEELVVRVDATAGFQYELQSGSDLTEWSPVEARVPTEDGELVFRVPLGPAERFVRIEASALPG